jgi:hypothetical protein
MAKEKYNFGEKEEEQGLEVWQSPKYKESKKKAIEMIESGKYDLSEADFWILMNKTRSGETMAYTGLIISHNGCLKINDKLDNKVNSKCFSLDKEGYKNSLVYTYVDDDTYEVGEFNSDNGKNNYPYAMAFKRCFDRVVLKKSKLAYAGIYSEAEADEFKEPVEEKKASGITENQRTIISKLTEKSQKSLFDKFGVSSIDELTIEQASEIVKAINDKKGVK